jgi:hypothetical protein
MAFDHFRESDIEPFRMIITAPSASGKSVLVAKMLTEQLKCKFDHIYIICGTLFQPLFQRLKLEHKSDSVTNHQFDEYYAMCKENKENNKNSLIILDDIINTELTQKNSSLSREICRIRHYNTSIIITSQLYRALPPIVRSNCDLSVMFYANNKLEKKKMVEEIGDNFEYYYDQFTDKPYNYIFVNFRKNEMDKDRYTNQISF